MTRAESRSRVAQGAALLDRLKPGWFRQIDMSKLDLGSDCLCVIGQLYGRYNQTSWPRDPVIADAFGFFVQSDEPDVSQDYRRLEIAWRYEIAQRRELEKTPIVRWTHRERKALKVIE